MNRTRHRMVRTLAGLGLLACAGAPATADHEINWYTIDEGGAMFSVSDGGSYVLGGTIGQPDAGPSTSATYALEGGFWPICLRDCIEPQPIPTVSEWGLLVLALMLMTGAKVCFRRRTA